MIRQHPPRRGGDRDTMSFNDKVCLITGAGSGIGRALALALGADGAVVTVSDIDAGAAAQTARDINTAGPGRATHEPLDVTDADAVTRHVSAVAGAHGRLDYIFNNAGIAIAGDARDLEIEHWRRVIDVNLMGVLYGTSCAYKIMARQGFGHIVNIASLSGLIPFPTNIPYGTTKFAVVGLSTGLRAEGEALGVKVSAVCPGFIESNIYTASQAVNVQSDALGDELPFKKVPADVAASKILRGVERNVAVIVFPRYAQIFWWLYRLNSRFGTGAGRQMIRDFRKLRMDDSP
jgi:NAD(P)-dependent dehydrogenase (short-subunit alcohol dehydrogenase family)